MFNESNFRTVEQIKASGYGAEGTDDQTRVKGYAAKLTSASKKLADSTGNDRGEFFVPIMAGTQYTLNDEQVEADTCGVFRAESKDELPIAVGLKRGRQGKPAEEILADF